MPSAAAPGCALLASMEDRFSRIAAHCFICANWQRATRRLRSIRDCRSYAARDTAPNRNQPLRLVELRYYYFCRRNRHSSARGAPVPFDNGKSVQNFSSSKDCIHFADCTASNAVMRSGSHPLADHSVQPMSSATGGAEARRFAVSFFFSTR